MRLMGRYLAHADQERPAVVDDEGGLTGVALDQQGAALSVDGQAVPDHGPFRGVAAQTPFDDAEMHVRLP